MFDCVCDLKDVYFEAVSFVLSEVSQPMNQWVGEDYFFCFS